MTKRKFAVNFAIFFILIALNLFIVLKVIAREHKTAAMVSILDEIGAADALYAQEQPAEATASAKVSNARVANLKNFFRKYNSPLYDSAEHIVKVSDENKLDYRLIPAIAMKESTLCQAIPLNSYNCWGWGIYGNTVTRFPSYDEAITTVARGLKKGYIDQGLTTPEAIMAKYTGHPENDTWASTVNTVLRWLE